MNKLVVIFAMFMLFKPVLPVVEYVVLFDYIKNELCENRENVAMKCNGKCHLAKEMAKASDAPEKGNDKKYISVETAVVFCQEIVKDYGLTNRVHIHNSEIPSNYSMFYSYLWTAAVFHPPLV